MNGKKLTAAERKELRSAINVFQLNQDFLKTLGNAERKKFFVDLFKVDTSGIDAKLKAKELEAQGMRKIIDAYGEIDVTPVNEPDRKTADFNRATEKQRLTDLHNEYLISKENAEAKWVTDNDKHLVDIQEFNQTQRLRKGLVLDEADNLAQVRDLLAESVLYELFQKNLEKASEYLTANLKQPEPEKPIKNIPPLKYPDFEADKTEYNKLVEICNNLKLEQERYNNYLNRLARNNEKQDKKIELSNLDTEIRDFRKLKVAALSEYGKEINGLNFTEKGDVIFNDTHIDNLSTAQLVELGSALQIMYPDTLKIELIDRGESLGLTGKYTFKNAKELANKAERDGSVIIGTVVGEPPENVPEKYGFYIMDDGTLTSV